MIATKVATGNGKIGDKTAISITGCGSLSQFCLDTLS